MHSATTCISSSPYISHACCHLHRTFHDDATALACDYGIATSLPPHRALSDASTVSIYFMMHPLSIASALEKHIYCKICIVPSMDIAMNYW